MQHVFVLRRDAAIHHDPRRSFGVIHAQLDGLDQQIVEVERVRLLKTLLILIEDIGSVFPRRFPRIIQKILRRLPVILCVADARQDGLRRDQALVDLQVPGYCLHNLKLIGFVVDRELAGILQRFNLPAKQTHAERMKRRNQRITRTRLAQEMTHARLHLIGGFIRERDGKDLLGSYTSILDQVSYPVSNNPRLAAARARKNQDRAFAGFDGFELFRIEKFPQIHISLLATKRHRKHKISFVNYVPFAAIPL